MEYEVPGVNQTKIHPEIGLTFAKALRSVSAKIPMIMVGEIRDRETADIAIRASLIGHLSSAHCTLTMHRRTTRLIDMDIEPFPLHPPSNDRCTAPRSPSVPALR